MYIFGFSAKKKHEEKLNKNVRFSWHTRNVANCNIEFKKFDLKLNHKLLSVSENKENSINGFVEKLLTQFIYTHTQTHNSLYKTNQNN